MISSDTTARSPEDSSPATSENEVPNSSGRLLIVDDLHFNRRLLRDILKRHNFEMHEAADGLEALEKIEEYQFDTVLLDIMMPKLDGYEVCRRLKSDRRTEHIPIILITALTDRDSRLKGIDCGADDFLSKPIDAQYLPLRVRNSVHSKRLHNQAEENYTKLKEVEELRDGLLHMIIHDLRSPLFGVYGNMELLQLTANENGGLIDLNVKDSLDQLTQSRHGAEHVISMVNDLLDIHRMEENRMPIRSEEANLLQIIREGIMSLGAVLDHQRLQTDFIESPPLLQCDQSVIGRVVANLVGNAIKFSPSDTPIHIALTSSDTHLRVSVSDRAAPISPADQSLIFEKFGQAAARKEGRAPSTGLGLTFCKLAVEAHQGSIGVASREGTGNVFWFELPLPP